MKKAFQKPSHPRVVGIGDNPRGASVRRKGEDGRMVGEEPSGWRREVFSIEAEPPFRLDLTVWALRRRAANLVDSWDGTSFQRVLALADSPVGLSVTQTGGRVAPHLAVALTGRSLGHGVAETVRTRIEQMLGLRVDLSSFYRMAAADDQIDSLVVRFRGLKPPRFATVFESLLNAVALQQLSLEAGLSLLNRLAATYGDVVLTDQVALHALPRPDALASLRPQALRELGFSLRKGATIIELAQATATGRLDLENLDRLCDDEVVSRLTSLGGIGRWSAEYALLRGLGRLHVFPGDDVGARNNLARLLDLEPPLDYRAVGQAVSRWQPYAGMVYFHLLLERLGR
jgi:DNA-3-methyladenine glycosylase II